MKVKYLIDADLPRAWFHGLVRWLADLDVSRVHQVGLSTATDPEILAFAASDGRITISRDKSTMLDFAAERLERGEPMPGLLLVRPTFAGRHGRGLGVIINELVLIADCSDAEEWQNLIQFIPFLNS